MSDNRPRVEVFDDSAAVAAAAAERVGAAFARGVTAGSQNIVTLALAGGSTPRALYELLAATPERFSWSNVHVLFGDERCVPPAHADSNYRMAREAMLDRLADTGVLPAERVHRMPGELEPLAGASEYARVLGELFGLSEGQQPRIDVVLLGMGSDGHTASLFPRTAALDAEPGAVVLPNYVSQLDARRLTLTAHCINAAREVIFLVTGASKARALFHVLVGERDEQQYPSQLIAPADGKLTFLIDRAAAAELPPRHSRIDRVDHPAGAVQGKDA